MAEKSMLSPEVEAELGALGSVDLVVGVAAPDRLEDTRATIAAAQAGLSQHFPGTRAVVLRVHAGVKHPEVATGDATVPVLDLPCRAAGAGGWARAAAVQSVLEASHRLKARACAVVGAEVTSLTPEWIGHLLTPVAERGHDLVAPYYQRHAYSGAITSGIVAPLVRALYGKRLRYPLGGEFACSGRLVERRLGSGTRRGPVGAPALELQLLADAVAGDMRVCQAVLGRRTVAAGDATAGLSALLTEGLAPVFAEMERSTAVWQKIRGSAAVEMMGAGPASAIAPVTLDRTRLLDAFQLGQKNLRDVWGLVLPPSTLVELKRLASTPAAEFRLPDALWARIVFDFSLAYRTRALSRDHLMGALTPLYLGWLGSLHAELGDADAVRLEARLEQMGQQFDGEKPYLISRWRWPDRFIP